MIKYLFLGIVLLGVLLGGQGCASTAPARDAAADRAVASNPVVAAADSMVGAPYRYGGQSPRGFDCSGLVHYAYRHAGIDVPRTTGAQRRGARPVALDAIRPGDVLFFELDGAKVSHVGIYAGAGSFIHAPSTGKSVAYASLGSDYWRSHLSGAGRFH